MTGGEWTKRAPELPEAAREHGHVGCPLIGIIHGVSVCVSADHAALLSEAGTLLSPWRVTREPLPDDLRLDLTRIPDRRHFPCVSPEGEESVRRFRRTGASSGLSPVHHPEKGVWFLDFEGRARFIVNELEGAASAHFVRPESLHPRVLADLVRFALTELLKTRGLFTLHAGAVERGGVAVLFPGSSGSGKSTSCLSLLGAGFRLLADDHPFLRPSDPAVEVLAFPGPLYLTDRTLGFFPDLQLRSLQDPAAALKKRVEHERFSSASPERMSVPRLILFPEIDEDRSPRLAPLSRAEALQEIMRHAALFSGRSSTRTLFHVMGTLVAQCDSYRLFLGVNPETVPRIVNERLARMGFNAATGPES